MIIIIIILLLVVFFFLKLQQALINVYERHVDKREITDDYFGPLVETPRVVVIMFKIFT